MFNKSVKIDIPCPECGYKTKLSLREIESNPTYKCLGCNKDINLNASEFKKSLKDAEDQLKRLFK